MESRAFVLVHSPIVGPDTWQPVADELRHRGHRATVPVVRDDDGSGPFWSQHASAVVAAVGGEAPPGSRLILVAHSGAGQLLAHVGQALPAAGYVPDGYVFVDAGVPTGGTSRLAQLRAEDPEVAEELEAVFSKGGAFPSWSDELLSRLVPDARRRQRLAAGVRQLPFAYWQEQIPRVSGWPDARCGVLLLSRGYESTAQVARARGWTVRRLDTDNHFFMLVEPATVAEELVDLTARMQHPPEGAAGNA